MDLSQRAQEALNIVRVASQLAGRMQRELISAALTKQDKSPVTVADFAIQALLSKLLDERFPGERLVGEEESSDLRSPAQEALLQKAVGYVREVIPSAGHDDVCQWIDRGSAQASGSYWTLDPIDGTKGFLRKEQFAIALAWIDNGVIQLGALGCPRLNRDCSLALPEQTATGLICIAEQGKGTWAFGADGGTNAKRLFTSTVADPVDARVLRSAESGHTNVDQMAVFSDQLGSKAPPVGLDSQAKYALLAGGKAEVLVRLLAADKPNYRERIWDQAAGAIVLQEAGGTITDLDGKPLDFTCGRGLDNNRGVLATNGKLHADCLAALNRIGA